VSTDYIDVFYSPTDTETPFCAFVWQQGRVIDTVSYESLKLTAEWCKRQGLPVVSASADLRAELSLYGVETRPSDSSMRKQPQPGVVQVRLSGQSADVERVRAALSNAVLEGLHVTMRPPRPARESDGNGVWAFGTIIINQNPRLE
jgi:hypothetical protein